jgi:uncharacterized membrane protein YtjA (UPF0391 family)
MPVASSSSTQPKRVPLVPVLLSLLVPLLCDGTFVSQQHCWPYGQTKLERAMLNLVVTLLIIGLIAAVLGFGGIAGTSFALAKLIFFVVLVLFLISIIFGTIRRRPL